MKLILLIFNLFCFQVFAQEFTHPGISQSKADMVFMKKQVKAGVEPWKSAFEKLQEETAINFKVKAFTHVLRGPYGKPNIGGDDLSKGAHMAYKCALMWYLTDDQKYADKAIEIINKWSGTVWDFDYNDAKLLAAWTGHVWCNAAEILKYTPSGWKEKDIDQFRNMLMTTYYPLIRYYFPEANGNWDGAIIHSIIAIGIFTDNRAIFDNAINHFLYAPVNGSIFKYIFPSGQCQETMRDQAHVQLGLGEFAGAAHIAYTQGVDLFSVGNNRLALGYEFTAKFLLGESPHSYGRISPRAMKIRDDYEYVFQHYTAQGIALPYTKIAADSARAKASISVLTAARSPKASTKTKLIPLQISTIGYIAGAQASPTGIKSENVIQVQPGESIQDALNSASGKNKMVVARAGVHTLPTTLKIPSNVILSGEGFETILHLDTQSGVRDAIVNLDANMHDVTIQNLVLEGGISTEIHSDPNTTRSFKSTANRGGVMFLGNEKGQMKNITLKNVTVRNCTYNGVFISGAENVVIDRCDFTENGSRVVPGPRLQHNLLLTHCNNLTIKNSRLDTSPFGSGLAIGHCTMALIENNEIARNGWYGLLITESQQIVVQGNLLEGNDRSAVLCEFLYRGNSEIKLKDNLVQYNNGYGLETYRVKHLSSSNNTYLGNASKDSQEKISDDPYLIMN